MSRLGAGWTGAVGSLVSGLGVSTLGGRATLLLTLPTGGGRTGRENKTKDGSFVGNTLVTMAARQKGSGARRERSGKAGVYVCLCKCRVLCRASQLTDRRLGIIEKSAPRGALLIYCVQVQVQGQKAQRPSVPSLGQVFAPASQYIVVCQCPFPGRMRHSPKLNLILARAVWPATTRRHHPPQSLHICPAPPQSTNKWHSRLLQFPPSRCKLVAQYSAAAALTQARTRPDPCRLPFCQPACPPDWLPPPG